MSGMRLGVSAAFGLLALVATERTSHASEMDRAIDYGVPLAFLGSTRALQNGYSDVASALRLATFAVLMLPVWSARSTPSAAMGLGTLVLVEGADLASLACSGSDCRAALFAAELGG